MERVEFESAGLRLVGHLFLPEVSRGEVTQGVVVTGSWTTVKEQMPDLYARRVAAAGLAALSFDFRGFGESDGTPRDVEAPAQKAEDIRSAAAFLRARLGAGGVGALAICASSGYAAAATAADPKIRALAMVAPWLHDPELARAVYGGEAGVAERLARAGEARARQEAGGPVEYVPAASSTDPGAAMYGSFDYYLDAARGAIPQWPNRFAVMAWREWLEYDAMAAAPRIAVPTLMVHSRAGAIPQGAERFAARMRTAPRLVWTDGTQFDFYDREPNVGFSVAQAVEHFRRAL